MRNTVGPEIEIPDVFRDKINEKCEQEQTGILWVRGIEFENRLTYCLHAILNCREVNTSLKNGIYEC